MAHGVCNAIFQLPSMMTLHFLNDIANDAESTQEINHYVIFASLKSETIFKLMNRIPDFDIKFTRLGFEKAC